MPKPEMLIFRPWHEPTEAQKQSGNYAKKRVNRHGLDIAIENPAGSIRSGKDRNGQAWEIRLPFDYGYINGTLGVDGDHVDCFLGLNPFASKVYVVHARTCGDWDQFDEDKCMLGFDSEDDAKAAFLASYSDPRFLGDITTMPVEEFVEKVKATKESPQMIKSVLIMKSAPESKSELVREHKRLVAVLRSPSHRDDLEEAEAQEKELEEYEGQLCKALYQGREVTLDKPFRTPDGPKKFAVYVKNDKGNVIIVRFGDPNMEIKRDDPERRKNYRARHHCSDAKDKTTAEYWSCRMWSTEPVGKLAKAVTQGSATAAINYRLSMIAAQIGPLAAAAMNDPDAKAELDALLAERYTLMVASDQASL